MLSIIFTVIIAIILVTTHAQQVCQLTEPDILGPYYIPDAPRSEEQLCTNLPANDRLVLTGQVVDYDSKCTSGIPNVKLDLWQVIQ
jgi:protocatechuate 3,4-dioxygenase beta subunit